MMELRNETTCLRVSALSKCPDEPVHHITSPGILISVEMFNGIQ